MNQRCARGHSLDDSDNVYVRPNGKRECKTCSRRRSREFKERNGRLSEPQPLAVTRPRKASRMPFAKIPLDHIRKLHVIYQAGHSTRWLAERVWRRYGFSSESSAASAILRGFVIEGLSVRSPGEATALRYRRLGCSGCGGLLEGRTVGCGSCRRRHWQWKYRDDGKSPRPAVEADRGEERKAA